MMIFWSEWKDLTNENLASDTYITENSLFIQVKYIRTGTDETGEIEFTSIDFLGTREEIKFVAPTLMNSIFAKLIGTTELQKLELNLFKKLYFRGILPQYITRAENVDYKEELRYEKMLLRVDEALYEAKNLGKNRVVYAKE